MYDANKRLDKSQLLAEIDKIESISALFELVQKEGIDIRMHSFHSASCLPPKVTDTKNMNVNPLDKLKLAVKSAVENTR